MQTLTARRRTLAALALVAASLGALLVGRGVQLDDVTGYGHQRWVLPWFAVAVVLVLGGVGISLPQRTARRSVGAALAALDVVVVVLAATNSGFRFVWHTGEGELGFFVVFLGLVALALLVPAVRTSPPRTGERARRQGITGWARLVVYLCALTLSVIVAFLAGASAFEQRYCRGGGYVECDLAAIGGLFWAAVVLALGVVLVVIVEVAHWCWRRVGVADRDPASSSR